MFAWLLIGLLLFILVLAFAAIALVSVILDTWANSDNEYTQDVWF